MKNLLTRNTTYIFLFRYLLGIWLIPYGVSKILGLQCIILPFSSWQLPLEQVTGKTLTWAFISYSQWFQVLLGFLEFIPAIMLFFRKTALLGAILLLPVTINVLLINYALDLWPQTKIISLVLFLLNVLIILLHKENILRILRAILVKHGGKYRLPEIIFNTVVLVTLLLLIKPVLERSLITDVFTGAWATNHPNEWVLRQEKDDTAFVPVKNIKAYFMPTGIYNEINDSGVVANEKYTIDKQKHLLYLSYAFDNYLYGHFNNGIYKYKFTHDSILTLEKVSGNINATQILTFHRRVVKGGAL